MRIRLIPPAASAFLPDRGMPTFPIFSPANEIANETAPIIREDERIGTFSPKKLIPAASESMLVAIDRRIRFFVSNGEPLLASSSSKDSFIILIPKKTSSAKAIHGANSEIIFLMLNPAVQLNIGIMAWNMPKKEAIFNAFFHSKGYSVIPEATDTDKQSIARPAAIMRISHKDITLLYQNTINAFLL